MLRELRRQWGVLPTWVKMIPVAGLWLAFSISLAHLRPDQGALRHALGGLFYLPLFMASLLFGLRGGLILAFLISLNYYPNLAHPLEGLDGRWLMTTGLDVALYFLTGLVTGVIADRERREARRLKEAENLALLGQAAAAVAHELKSPLIAIGGFAQRMQRDLDEGHPHLRMLSIIVEQARHMEQLLREMLDYSRPLDLNLEHQPLPPLVEECLELLAHQAEQKGVTLETQGSPYLPIPELDPGRIKQVLLNLVQNAIQASSRGGAVRVETRQEGGWLLLEVRDQGSGIRKEDQAKVFFPFFTTKRQGTGLGLAIARKIVESHGGQLEFSSHPGKGTTFSLHLPLVASPR
jgi:signal transduction histidine kinase